MSAAADPERPRRLLDAVLARPEFHNNPDGADPWLERLLERLFGAAGSVPHWMGDLVLVGVLVAAAFLLLGFLSEERARRRAAAVALREERAPARAPRSAEEWFRLAAESRRAGRAAEAVVRFFRAMIARMVERGFLLPDPSRTNREHSRDLRARPRERELLLRALPAFENVRYGGRDADPEDAERAERIARELMGGGAS